VSQPQPFQGEITPVGKQTLIPGIRPITIGDRMKARMDAPLVSRKPQKLLDIGLFDEIGRNQLELF
jgi:hypothetical protein